MIWQQVTVGSVMYYAFTFDVRILLRLEISAHNEN